MKLAVLFSGGKDSCLAYLKAKSFHEVSCLITIRSENPESYMFHTPNISLTELQSEAMGIPLITASTSGKKEKELSDLKKAIGQAISLFGIEGIVTGAVGSVYQTTRVQKICDDLGLWCFNPLWQNDQVDLLDELIDLGFEVMISGVFAYPFDKSWLGKRIDRKMIEKLMDLQKKYGINPAGEGGEIETTVLYAPFFSKRLIITRSEVRFSNYNGVLVVKEASLI